MNALIRNSKSPKMWCSINKRNQSPPCCLNKSKPQFKFFALFSLCSPSPSVCCMSLNPCLPEGCLVNLSVFVSLCVYVSLTQGFCLHILNSTESFIWGRNEGYFAESVRVWQGVQLLSSTDPKNIIVNKIQCLWWIFLWYCFQPVFLLSSPNVRVFMHYSGLGSWQGT